MVFFVLYTSLAPGSHDEKQDAGVEAHPTGHATRAKAFEGTNIAKMLEHCCDQIKGCNNEFAEGVKGSEVEGWERPMLNSFSSTYAGFIKGHERCSRLGLGGPLHMATAFPNPATSAFP